MLPENFRMVFQGAMIIQRSSQPIIPPIKDPGYMAVTFGPLTADG